MSIADNLSAIKNELPPDVKLVAVSKFKPVEQIWEAYSHGQKDFGENRPQELASKMKELPEDIVWHFIGHLQTNKIKMIIDRVNIIESIDSEKLLKAVDAESLKIGRVVDCLLEYHISLEESKQGFSADEILGIASLKDNFKGIRICGIMAMASLTNNESQLVGEFSSVRKLFEKVKSLYFKDDDFFKVVSMGMSGDFKIAVKEGSNNVRIGSAIFGSR
jgi:pyridoxal phosphate enzyme (YggS family)